MAALLVALSVMAVLASAAMPSWKQMTQREKEAELVFRGQQYARAIGLFQRRAGPGVNPPNLDVLVQQKFLRKKYKDPITGGDFDLISPTTPMAVPTSPTPGGQTGDRTGRVARHGHDARHEPRWPVAAGVELRPRHAARWRRSGRLWRHRRGRHRRRAEQEQGAVDSHLQRTNPLQRMAVRLHPAGRAARRPRPAWRPRTAWRSAAGAHNAVTRSAGPSAVAAGFEMPQPGRAAGEPPRRRPARADADLSGNKTRASGSQPFTPPLLHREKRGALP